MEKKNDHSIFSERMRAMALARKRIMEEDARHIIQVVQRSALRTGARDTFQLGDPLLIWGPKSKDWSMGHRFLADVGRNLVIEKGGQNQENSQTMGTACFRKKKTMPDASVDSTSIQNEKKRKIQWLRIPIRYRK